MIAPPTKTFGLHTPYGLLLKLGHDIRRLEEARSTTDVQYSALDCATAAWHLVDWVLNSVGDEHYQALSGETRGDRQGEFRAPTSFLQRNSHRLPHLVHCQQIANTGKHLVLTRSPDDPLLTTRTGARFDPPFKADAPETWKDVRVIPVAYVQIGERPQYAYTFFREVEMHWLTFLMDERLISSSPDPETGNVFA